MMWLWTLGLLALVVTTQFLDVLTETPLMQRTVKRGNVSNHQSIMGITPNPTFLLFRFFFFTSTNNDDNGARDLKKNPMLLSYSSLKPAQVLALFIGYTAAIGCASFSSSCQNNNHAGIDKYHDDDVKDDITVFCHKVRGYRKRVLGTDNNT